MEISCIVSPQKPESIFYRLRHNSLRVSNENSERLFSDRDYFPCENCHNVGDLCAIGMNKIQNYWNFKHEIESTRSQNFLLCVSKVFSEIKSCHNSSPERIFFSWGSSQKEKQLKLFFAFMDFSIPLNVLSKLFQFLFSKNNLFALSTRILANISPFSRLNCYIERWKKGKCFKILSIPSMKKQKEN